MKKLLQINMSKDRKRRKKLIGDQNIIFQLSQSLNVNHFDFPLLFKTQMVGQV